MEGPWLNPDPGCRGAHRSEWMTKAGPRHCSRNGARRRANLIKLITLAPEIDPDASTGPHPSRDREQGIRFFAGHSAPWAPRSRSACAAGSHLAGLTSAMRCRPSVPKFENVLLHVLAQPGLLASLIPDGAHVPPHAFRALAGALGPRLLLTTDAMAAAGATGHRPVYARRHAGAGRRRRLRAPARFRAPRRFHADALRRRLPRGANGRPLSRGRMARLLDATGPPAGSLASSSPPATRPISASSHPTRRPILLATYHRGECVYEAA